MSRTCHDASERCRQSRRRRRVSHTSWFHHPSAASAPAEALRLQCRSFLSTQLYSPPQLVVALLSLDHTTLSLPYTSRFDKDTLPPDTWICDAEKVQEQETEALGGPKSAGPSRVICI